MGFVKRLMRSVLGLSFYLFDGLCLLFLPARKPSIASVLVVRFDNIGDSVLWLPAAKALRTIYPATEWRLVLAASQAWADLADQLGLFDEVWSIDTRRLYRDPVYRLRVFGRIRRAGFQIAIHPTYSREMFRGDALIRASGANQRIGSQGDCSNMEPWLKPLADRIYTRLVPATDKPISELERNAEFVAALGFTGSLGMPSLPAFPASLPEVLEAISFFVLFPGASWTGRQWPATHFATLAERIGQQTGWITVICGGAGDAVAAQAIKALLTAPTINLVGKTDLKQLLAALAAARIVITNETSVAHMAPAVGTPTVCILGGGHYGRFLPYPQTVYLPNMAIVNEPMECYGCNWRCIYPLVTGSAVPCVARISVEAVWQAVLGLGTRVSGCHVAHDAASDG